MNPTATIELGAEVATTLAPEACGIARQAALKLLESAGLTKAVINGAGAAEDVVFPLVFTDITGAGRISLEKAAVPLGQESTVASRLAGRVDWSALQKELGLTKPISKQAQGVGELVWPGTTREQVLALAGKPAAEFPYAEGTAFIYRQGESSSAVFLRNGSKVANWDDQAGLLPVLQSNGNELLGKVLPNSSLEDVLAFAGKPARELPYAEGTQLIYGDANASASVYMRNGKTVANWYDPQGILPVLSKPNGNALKNLYFFHH